MVMAEQTLQKLVITITPVNDPPVAINNTGSTLVNIPIVINVVTNDDDPNDPFGSIDPSTIDTIPGSGPLNGTVTINTGTGEFTYTPNFGFVGIDSFAYVVCDDGNPLPPQCDTALVRITISQDTDSDGIADHIDLDDDNDGIPDNEEDNCNKWFTFNASPEGWYTINNNNNALPGTIPASHSTDPVTANVGCTITITGAANANIAGASPTLTNYIVDADPSGGTMWIRSPQLGGQDWRDLLNGTFEYSHYNYRVGFTGNPVWSGSTNGQVVLYGTNGSSVSTTHPVNLTDWENGIWNTHIITMNDASWTGTISDLTDVLASVDYMSIRMEFINGGNTGVCGDVEYYAIDNIIGSGPVLCDNDFDNDGIPNSLDLDSDNDGLFDAVEAGHGFPLTNGAVNGAVSADGIPDVAQSVSGVNSGVVDYNIADTDNDSIANYLDTDSDGDGCADAIEAAGSFTAADIDSLRYVSWSCRC